jgi:hypothetical protein
MRVLILEVLIVPAVSKSLPFHSSKPINLDSVSSELQALELDSSSGKVGKIVVGLLGEPAFGATAEHL